MFKILFFNIYIILYINFKKFNFPKIFELMLIYFSIYNILTHTKKNKIKNS